MYEPCRPYTFFLLYSLIFRVSIKLLCNADVQQRDPYRRELQEKGLLPSGNIVNPKTDENFNLNNSVTITYNGTKYSYNYDTAQDE